jgi:hypothetical protein
VDVYGVGYATAKGVRIGMTEADVRARYPAVQVLPPRYDATGHSLTLATTDGRHAIVFETDGRAVTTIRSGALPFVSRPDACP